MINGKDGRLLARHVYYIYPIYLRCRDAEQQGIPH